MNLKSVWNKVYPHLGAAIIFIVIAFIYLKPATEGMVLQQSDSIQFQAMAKDLSNYVEKHGHNPLWINNQFSGMPSTSLSARGFDIGIFGYLTVNRFFNFLELYNRGNPISLFFIMCIGFYFLTQVIGIRYWISILGSIAFAYSSNTPILIHAGHITKVWAIAYSAFCLASLILIFKKKYLWGATLLTIFLTILQTCRHLQISYYFMIVALITTLFYIIPSIKEKDYKHIIKSFLICVSAILIMVCVNIIDLSMTQDYAKATMRGGSELLDDNTTNNIAKKETKKSSGLSIDYAFNWSYGIFETFTLMVPNVQGGGSSTPYPDDSKFFSEIINAGVNQQQAQSLAQQIPMYWGNQPFTSGPIYIGVIIIFLFIYGMFYIKTWHKWWIGSLIFIAIIMSWGKNFGIINDFLFYNLPFYNKFRVPSMILYIPHLLMPFFAVFFLNEFVKTNNDTAFKIKCLKNTLYVFGGFLIVLLYGYFNFNFSSENEKNLQPYFNQLTQGNVSLTKSIIGGLKSDRQSIYMSDLIRSYIFVILIGALIWLFIKNKIKSLYFIFAVLILCFIDLINVDSRYLNSEMFVEKQNIDENVFRPSEIDNQIMADPTHPRVLDLSKDPFNDAGPSYFHKNIGGYSPAKLSIYEDILNFQLRKKINIKVLNILNCKYVINKDNNGQVQLQVNNEALGYCWLVNKIKFYKTPKQVMNALDSFEPKNEALLLGGDSSSIGRIDPISGTNSYIKLINNDNDYIEYEANTNATNYAVLSEVFYTREGWHAYIDGKETNIYQTNYVLRGIVIPTGKHKIVFEFKPKSFYKVGWFTALGNTALYALFIIAVIITLLPILKQKNKKNK